MDSMPQVTTQISQLQAVMAALEAQRPALGDATVDSALASLRAQLTALQAQSTPATLAAPASLDAQLNQLSQAALIRLFATEPDLAYIFKHALIQEAAYESMLHAEQRVLHRVVAQTYERLYADRVDDYAALLEHHYAAARDTAKTIEYALRAGDAAARRFAFPEARAHFERALDAIALLADSPAKQQQFVAIVIKLAEVAWGSDRPERNLVRLSEAEQFAYGLPEPDGQWLRAQIYYWIGRMQFYRNDYAESLRAFEKAVANAAHLPAAQRLLDEANSVVGVIQTFQGQFGRAATVLADALARLEKSANWPAWIRIAAFSGMCLAARGQYRAGVTRGEQALARAVESNLRGLLPVSHIWLALIHLLGGDIRQWLAASYAATNAAIETDDQLVTRDACQMLAWGESRLGNHRTASDYLLQAQLIARKLGGRVGVNPWLLAGEAEIASNAGQPDEALAKAERAITSAQNIDSLFLEGMARRVKARALIEQNPLSYEAALSEFAQSLRVLELGEARLEAARTRVAWAQYLQRRGDWQAARAHAEQAAAQFAASALSAELEQTRAFIAILP